MPVTQFDQLDLAGYYTYQDYMTWTFPERVELFLGKVVAIGPSPNRYHHDISQHISMPLYEYSKNRSIQVYFAPFDVRLPVSLNEGLYDTVVQPDIVVICDPSKLDEQGCIGAPDIVIEILPPGNSRREMKDKFDLYEASLVPEYWIVDPIHQYAIIYTIDNEKKYIGSRPYMEGHSIESPILPGFKMDVGGAFKKR